MRTIPEVAKDPHLWEREMLVKMDDAVAGEMFVPGATIKMSRTPGRVGPVPTPGSTPTSCWRGCSATTPPGARPPGRRRGGLSHRPPSPRGGEQRSGVAVEELR